MAGPAPRVPEIAERRSCVIVPMTWPVFAILEDLEGRGKNRDDLGRAHRQFDVAERKHRMTERGDAVAIDARNGTGASERDVAGDEGDCDGGSGAQRRRWGGSSWFRVLSSGFGVGELSYSRPKGCRPTKRPRGRGR